MGAHFNNLHLTTESIGDSFVSSTDRGPEGTDIEAAMLPAPAPQPQLTRRQHSAFSYSHEVCIERERERERKRERASKDRLGESVATAQSSCSAQRSTFRRASYASPSANVWGELYVLSYTRLHCAVFAVASLSQRLTVTSVAGTSVL